MHIAQLGREFAQHALTQHQYYCSDLQKKPICAEPQCNHDTGTLLLESMISIDGATKPRLACAA